MSAPRKRRSLRPSILSLESLCAASNLVPGILPADELIRASAATTQVDQRQSHHLEPSRSIASEILAARPRRGEIGRNRGRNRCQFIFPGEIGVNSFFQPLRSGTGEIGRNRCQFIFPASSQRQGEKSVSIGGEIGGGEIGVNSFFQPLRSGRNRRQKSREKSAEIGGRNRCQFIFPAHFSSLFAGQKSGREIGVNSFFQPLRRGAEKSGRNRCQFECH